MPHCMSPGDTLKRKDPIGTRESPAASAIDDEADHGEGPDAKPGGIIFGDGLQIERRSIESRRL